MSDIKSLNFLKCGLATFMFINPASSVVRKVQASLENSVSSTRKSNSSGGPVFTCNILKSLLTNWNQYYFVLGIWLLCYILETKIKF
jgi:hypothetical protein